MPKLPIFRLRSSEPPSRPDLQYYGPTLAFTDLKLGVDNLRYDVFLSPRITADLSFHLARYICRFGEVESLFEMDVPSPTQIHTRRRERHQIAQARPHRPQNSAGLDSSRHPESRQGRKQSIGRCARPPGRAQVHTHRTASAVCQDSRTVPHEVEVARGRAANENDADAGARLLFPGAQEDHPAPRRPGDVSSASRNRKRNAGPHSPLASRRIARRFLSSVPQSADSYRRWARRLSLRRALLYVRQLRQRSRPLPQSPPVRAKFSARTGIRRRH